MVLGLPGGLATGTAIYAVLYSRLDKKYGFGKLIPGGPIVIVLIGLGLIILGAKMSGTPFIHGAVLGVGAATLTNAILDYFKL